MQVNHNTAQTRFEIDLGDGMALLEYIQKGKEIAFTHTEVPVAYKGQGIGSQLAKTALEYAKQRGYKVQVRCSFVAGYIQRHPEYQSLTQ
jgi:predicted GNAT family acetyltransferase